MKKTALFFLLSAVFASSCILSVSPTAERWALIEDNWGDRLKVETVSDEVWALLVQLHYNGSGRWIGGIVERYENEWGFRFDPDTILVAVATIEVWQTTIRGISEDLDYWLGEMAVVGANVVEINAIKVPDEYPTIQAAINHASDGDTIAVASGTCYEHVIIDKSLTLIGENPSTTIVDGNRTGQPYLIYVAADDVRICGFTITNSSDTGIRLSNYSSGLTLTGNIITSNINEGISLGSFSRGNNIYGNIISNNVKGIHSESTSDNVISRNTLASNNHGIVLENSSRNTVSGNTITLNIEFGVHLYRATRNTISGNTISKNEVGAFLETSSNNTVYRNNFINNTNQVNSINSTNAWDKGEEGNYWSNYTGTDADGDGIGDTPHVIDENNQDNYPVMKPRKCDVAVIWVFPHPSEVFVGQIVNISVGVRNEGTLAETFNVTTYYNNIIIQTQTVTNLSPYKQTELIFRWNTTGVAIGTYIITAEASEVPGEIDTADNINPVKSTVKIIAVPPVGGIYVPVNKLELLAPYIGLTILLAVAVMTVGYVKKRKRHTGGAYGEASWIGRDCGAVWNARRGEDP